MKEIKKIEITGSSGWGADIEMYDERLILTDHSISFKHVPMKIPEEIIPCRPFWNQEIKWSYKTRSQNFADGFHEAAALASNLFHLDFVSVCTDIGPTDIKVKYEDGSKDTIRFWDDGELFYPLRKAIRKLILPVQKIPILLRLPEDMEDATDEDDDFGEDDNFGKNDD